MCTHSLAAACEGIFSRACHAPAIECHFDAHILSWSILRWLWSTGIEHQPGPEEHATPPLPDLQGMGQGYRPSLDTFAPSPPAGGGYVASQLPDRLTHPEVTNRIDASARMHSDLAALRLHGPALGIDSDYIRVAHAYHCHLEIAHAHFSYAASHLQARGAARAGPYPAHLDHAPPVESCGRHSPVLTAPGASMSSSSDYVTHDGGVGTSPDPGRVVHNLPNIGIDGGGDAHFLQRGMFNSALPHTASGILLSTPSPTHAISGEPPIVVGCVGNFMQTTMCDRASSVRSCVGPRPDMSAPEVGHELYHSYIHVEGGGDTLVAPGRMVQNLPNGNFMQPELSEPRPCATGDSHLLDRPAATALSSHTLSPEVADLVMPSSHLTCHTLCSDFADVLPDFCDTFAEGGGDTVVAPGRVVQNLPKDLSWQPEPSAQLPNASEGATADSTVPPLVVSFLPAAVGNFMSLTREVLTTSVTSCVGPCPGMSAPDVGKNVTLHVALPTRACTRFFPGRPHPSPCVMLPQRRG